MLGVLAFIFASYGFRWSWTGFLNKALWDWLQLLIVPVVLAIGAFLFNLATSQREHEIAADNQRATLLQSYLDRMSELLLINQLRESNSTSEVRVICQDCNRILDQFLSLYEGRKSVKAAISATILVAAFIRLMSGFLEPFQEVIFL